jgi:hypothetical protein
MGDVWAMLFLIGLIMLPVLAFGSIGIVIFLALKIAAREPRPSAAWRMVAVHVALLVGVGITLEIAAAWCSGSVLWAWLSAGARVGSVVVVPLVLYRRFRRLPPREPESDIEGAATGAVPGVDHGSGVREEATFRTTLDADDRRTANRIAWIVGVTGTLAPWLVGLGVKVYLQSVGRPTLPIASFLDPVAIPVLLIATLAMWSFPFVLLALLARFWFLPGGQPVSSFRSRTRLVWLTYAAGMVITVPVFVGVFWEFDMMYLFVPVGLFLCPFMASGYAAGRLLVRRGWIRS